jgi:hypothetical protein
MGSLDASLKNLGTSFLVFQRKNYVPVVKQIIARRFFYLLVNRNLGNNVITGSYSRRGQG